MKWNPAATRGLERATEQAEKPIELRPYNELPPAMVKYFADRLTRVSKHAGGHRGQKAKAHMRAHGTFGKARRRLNIARRRVEIGGRRATLLAQSTSNESAE